MRPHRDRLLLPALCSVFLVFPSPSASQTGAPQPAAPSIAGGTEITVEMFQDLKKKAQEAVDLDESVRAGVVELYDRALQHIQTAGNWAAQAAGFEKAMQETPGLLTAIREELAQPIPDATPEIKPEWSLSQMEQFLAQAEAEHGEAQKRLSELETEANGRLARRKDLPGLTAKAREQLAGLTTQKAAAIPSEGTPELIRAQRQLLSARHWAVLEEVNSYEKEVLSYDARGDLLTARRDHAARRVTLLERRVAAWRSIVAERREIEADEAARKAREARREVAIEYPVLQSLAEENAQLADKRRDLTGSMSLIGRDLGQIKATLASIRTQAQQTRTRLDAVGLTHDMGLLMRTQRADLPDLRYHRNRIHARQSTISAVQMDWYEYSNRRSALADIDLQIQQILTDLKAPTDEDRTEITARVRELLETQRDSLLTFTNDTDAYFNQLASLNTAEQQLVSEVEEYKEFIDEHVLWIRSTDLPRPSDVLVLWKALFWLVAPENWAGMLGIVRSDVSSAPLIWALFIVLFGTLVSKSRMLRATLAGLNKRVETRRLTDTFADTIRALVCISLMCATWPFPLGFLAWRLSAISGDSEFALSVAQGLGAAAAMLFTLEFLRLLCRSRGVGQIHFRWPVEYLIPIRRNLRWAIAVVVPLASLLFTMDWQKSQEFKDVLGRLLFIAYAIAVAVFVWRALRPLARAAVSRISSEEAAILRLFQLGYQLPLFLFIGLSAMALVGYLYTALQLNWRFVLTTWFILGLVIANGLIHRWLLLTHRALAIQETRRRLESVQTDKALRAEQADTEDQLPQRTESDLDLASINVQTRTLIRSFLALTLFIGIWFMWSDMLPALRFLDRVELWDYTAKVTETITAADGTKTISVVERPQSVTLKSIVIALVVIAMTAICAKNIPGLLEMAVLQRLPVQSASRYAMTTVARYIIGVIGVVAICKTLGITWSSVQWLVAAMTVGLGFGLQEIFANFVSGLIILFERPIRLGDTITVGDVSGTVTRIRIRATTVTDWDKKELIVPNKEFITGRLINWSLSDEVLRVVIRIGVAYGTDIGIVHKILHEVAKDNPHVLEHPLTKVVFEEFGDSSLNFTLRVYIPSVDYILKVRDELNTAIDAAFREAGIEIPFPQRDLHVRSIEKPISVRQFQEESKEIASNECE